MVRRDMWSGVGLIKIDDTGFEVGGDKFLAILEKEIARAIAISM